jgi:hypothetical protein
VDPAPVQDEPASVMLGFPHRRQTDDKIRSLQLEKAELLRQKALLQNAMLL